MNDPRLDLSACDFSDLIAVSDSAERPGLQYYKVVLREDIQAQLDRIETMLKELTERPR